MIHKLIQAALALFAFWLYYMGFTFETIVVLSGMLLLWALREISFHLWDWILEALDDTHEN